MQHKVANDIGEALPSQESSAVQGMQSAVWVRIPDIMKRPRSDQIRPQSRRHQARSPGHLPANRERVRPAIIIQQSQQISVHLRQLAAHVE
jgi:hypothetical protein